MTMPKRKKRSKGDASPLETATFGLGCFWGPDAEMGVMPGVERTRVGYAGGTTPDPTYQQIGDHTEVVQVDFDFDACSYADLLAYFWEAHNPERAPYKRQYRSLILVDTEEQLSEASSTYEKESRRRGSKLSTSVEKLDRFYAAEDYHQKYSLRRDATLMEEFEQQFPDPSSFRDAPEAALVNGFVAGYGTDEQVEDYLEGSFLSPTGRRHLRVMHGG